MAMHHPAMKVAALSLSALLLAGCAGAPALPTPPPAAPSATASTPLAESPSPVTAPVEPAAEPSPAPTPTAPPPVAAPAPIADPDYDYTSFLGASMSGTAADAATHIGLDLITDATCEWIGTFDFPLAAAPIEVGVWESLLGDGADQLVFFMGGDPTPGAYDDMEPYLNAEGVGLGTSAAQVLAAYPGATVETNNYPSVGPITEILVAGPGGEGMYDFWVAGAAGDVYQVFWGDVDPSIEARGYYCYSEV